MSNNLPPPQGRPHVRLNSGSGGDLLDQDAPSQHSQSQQPQSRPQTSRTPSSRSLIPSSQRPTTAPQNPSPLGPPTPIYSTPAGSQEMLLPPRKSKQAKRFRDDESIKSETFRSPPTTQSRRTSWSSGSDASRDSRNFSGGGAFGSPFDNDSRAPSRAGSDDEGVNTQTVSEKYNILPSAGLLLFPEDVEKDDWLHTPDPNDRDKMNCMDLFSKRGLVNVGGLALITVGILILFIGYPILTFVQKAVEPDANSASCSENPLCLKSNGDLLKNTRQTLIDPDTPSSAMSRTGEEGGTQNLVFSDEFNHAGRTFYAGDDPVWEGVDIWYGATQDIEWYNPDALTTKDGYLEVRFDAFRTHGLNYRSGMLQSWNKLCYKGGYIEASISLPGRGDVSGFWPGFWTMGNLGRPGYLATTDGMWPFSYHDECDAGITPNQSDPDGLSELPGIRLPACPCVGSDHPSPGLTRTAPEIDALEGTVDYLIPPAGGATGSVSQSFQIAPFDILFRPNTEFMEVYDRSITRANAYQGGPFQQALSGLSFLNNDWYGGRQYQSYGFEYEPGDEGWVLWDIGGVKTWKIMAAAIGPNGNIGQRTIAEEPMTVIINLGMAEGFATVDFEGLADLFPGIMRVDYVRIYQGEEDELGCDPVGYPTTQYIADHPEPYANANLTRWDRTRYEWPDNSYMAGCEEAEHGSYKKAKLAKRDQVQERKARRSKRSWIPWR